MLGFRYHKAGPTTYVFQIKDGKTVREGTGVSFWYFAPSSNIVSVNIASVDSPFLFEEVTADYQDITIQGQLTYRVSDAEKLTSLLDHSIDSRGRYTSDDPTKLSDRLTQLIQVRARAFTQKNVLEELLTSSDQLGEELMRGLTDSKTTAELGIEVLSLVVLSVKAEPEMAKAMQATAREQLLLRADEAVYSRRNTAIELERQITENELKTELFVAEKNREVSETKLAADTALEKQRADLVAIQVENDSKVAQSNAENTAALMEALGKADWRTLALANGQTDAKQIIAMAFEQLAENAQKIGRLDISPDMLRTLMQDERD